MSPYAWLPSGGYILSMVAALQRRETGTWNVFLVLPHVAFGQKYGTLSANAVFDDFGDLVLIGDAFGQVVLQ